MTNPLIPPASAAWVDAQGRPTRVFYQFLATVAAQVNAGAGLASTGIVNNPTLSIAPISAGSLFGNAGVVAAVPQAIAVGTNLSLSASGTLSAQGGVISITAGAGLAGGVITSSGTLSLAPFAATTLFGNPTGSSAVGQAVSLGSAFSFSGTTLEVVAGSGNDNFIASGLFPPSTASFTWINQGSATAANQTSGPMQMFYPAAASLSAAFFGVAVPGSTPWTATAEVAIIQSNTNAHVAGIAVTDGTKFIVLYLGTGGLTVQPWNSTSSAGSSDYANVWSIPGPAMFLRIYNDGSNYNFQVSGDGVKYQTLFSQGNTAFLTATRVGLFMATNDSGDAGIVMNVWGWEAVTGAGTVLAW